MSTALCQQNTHLAMREKRAAACQALLRQISSLCIAINPMFRRRKRVQRYINLYYLTHRVSHEPTSREGGR